MRFHLFPFETIEKGSRIVIYGAGLVCLEYLAQIEKTGHCGVIGVLDRNFENYVNFPMEVFPPKKIADLDGYSLVLLALSSPQYVAEAKRTLAGLGVPESRIVHPASRVIFVNERWRALTPEQKYVVRQLRRERKRAAEHDFSPPRAAPGVLDIAVTMNGGLGDYLQISNYLKEVYKHAGCDCRFHILAHRDANEFKAIFGDCPFVKSVTYFGNSQGQVRKLSCFDISLDISRCPQLIRWNEEKVERLSPKLAALCRAVRDFPHKNFNLYRPLHDTLWTMYSLANGRRRSNQYDIDGVLGMRPDVKPLMLLNPDSFGILERHGLKPGGYATLQRGVVKYMDQKKCTRLWPLPYYDELVALLRKRFPRCTLVLLGEKTWDLSSVGGVDLDLRGKTSFDELKVVLKHSALHIDGECGMVHMKNALNGKSAVFFGQTRPDFTGYPENLNLSANACPVWCEWVTDDWDRKCMRGFEQPPCMTELKPELAMREIGPELASRLRTPGTWAWSRGRRAAMGGKAGNIIFLGEYRPEEYREYARNGRRVRAFVMDIDPARLREAERGGYELEFAGVHNIPEPDDSVDAAIWNGFDPAGPGADFALLEIRRVLREGGTLHIRAVPGASGAGEGLKEFVSPGAGGNEAFLCKCAAATAGKGKDGTTPPLRKNASRGQKEKRRK